MKVGAYQAPLAAARSPEVIDRIAAQIVRCEADGFENICCPETVLGGLADYADASSRITFASDGRQLARTLAPLARRRGDHDPRLHRVVH